MNFPRTNVNGVLLPDRTILAVGGQRNGKWSADPQPVLVAAIYHPATNTWTLTAPMAHPRQYQLNQGVPLRRVRDKGRAQLVERADKRLEFLL